MGQGCEGDLTGPDRESASIRGWSDYPQGRIDTYVSSASDGACRSTLRREEGDQRQQLWTMARDNYSGYSPMESGRLRVDRSDIASRATSAGLGGGSGVRSAPNQRGGGASSPAVSKGGRTMADVGKTNIVVMWTVGPDDVAEGDRIFESHVNWMTGHPRDGDTALLSYRISKGPELSNPVDPNSDPTGNTIFVLSEVYETPAGVAEHWKQAVETWQDLPAFMDWSAKVKVGTLHSGTVVQGLW
jgi:hypothetical protein